MSVSGAASGPTPVRHGARNGRLIAFGIVVGLVLIGISSCWLAFAPTHIRYRLTIEVQDGDVVRSGSGVVDVAYGVAPLRGVGGSQWDAFVYGNAVTVDLGTKGLLFAIVRRDYRGGFPTGYLPIVAYGLEDPYNSPERLEADLIQLKRKSGWVEVPSEALPLLIRYRDINDPNSVQKVDPSNLAASFGAGVELKSAKLELTNDPLTPVPSVWPTWIKELGTAEYANHSVTCGVNPFCLQGEDFKGL
jgi:hypothetical protein